MHSDCKVMHIGKQPIENTLKKQHFELATKMQLKLYQY